MNPGKIFIRDDRFDPGKPGIEIIQDFPGPGRTGSFQMSLQKLPQLIRLRGGYGMQPDVPGIEPGTEFTLFIQNPGDTAGHARGEVVSNGTEDGHPAAGHILTAVIPGSLHDGVGAGIAHGKALAGHAGHKGQAACGAVERHIADQGVPRAPDGVRRGTDGEGAAGKPFAEIIVGDAVERDLLPGREESAEGLAAAALGLDMAGAFEQGAEGAVCGGQAYVVLIQPGIRAVFQMEIMALHTEDRCGRRVHPRCGRRGGP